MRCVICKQEETRAGETTVTLERQGATILFKNVPAEICNNCGEAYVDESVTGKLLGTAEQAASAGVLVDVLEYTQAVA